MSRVLEKAKKLSVPTKLEEDRTRKVADLLLGKVKAEAARHPEVVSVELGGSYAKGTWLRKQMDFDIFIKIRTDTDSKRFEEVGMEIGFASMKKLNPRVRYSEHPYVEAEIGGTKVNVVPCYNVEAGQWKSAADRSSFHTKFILENFDDGKKNEVRLLKKFLKGVGIYGAEIAKEGFGGYAAEVLVHSYGTFLGVLQAASGFGQGQTVGSPTKKFETPLVLIDPIDSNRNLGTAISAQNVARFILASRAFLKKESILFFEGRKLVPNSKNLKNIVIVRFNYKWRSPDIIWGQTKRAAASLAGQLELGGFEVIRRAAVTDEKSEAAMIFLLRLPQIENFVIKNGPEVYRRSDSENFVSKNSGNIMTWVDENARILSMQKREFSDAKRFLEHLLKKKIKQAGIPAGIIPDLRHGFRILRGNQPVSKSIKKALSEVTSTDGLIFNTGK
ncbi:MAG TPA: CCA tRNA nucleotidyltransferase [Candidatus Nitrosotalea sp.]|nr:CCA tRNA nucleotidyltransferase [Candidatus Nitrosotalea sp.]